MTVETPERTDPVDPARGLTAAQVAQRVSAGQVNVAGEKTGRTVGEIIRANVFTRINAMLGVLFALVMTTGSFKNGLFGLIIIANSGIGIIQEIRAKQTLDRLSIVGQAKPAVRRDGVAVQVAPEEVVLDDIIELGPGDQIVVDGETVESAALDVDESLLTGEADAVDKAVGDKILSGSFVVSGSGSYRATKVGSEAYAAKLAAEASKFTLVDSELRNGINKILQVITWLLIPAGILTIINQLFIAGDGSLAWESVKPGILGMVAALVPMVPEGLVLMTSIAFAVGVVRLGQRQCLVNELPAIEGLARVNIVCADKTGTLTENGMRLSELQLIDGSGVDEEQARAVLAAMAAADPRPNASIEAIGEAYPDGPNWTATSVQPFSSALKWSGMSFADASGSSAGNWLIGAPDILLDPSSAVSAQATAIGETGLRVLLLARTDIAVDEPGAVDQMTPVALVILEQRVRPDAKDTLDYFERQHVAVKVISGDNARSVGAVAASLGLGSVENAVDGRQLPKETDELAEVVTDGTVFGRIRPDQKRAMVKALQSRHNTVAMTGDGVNDVLALKDADIGVAMGSGSSAARSVAQIVLLDNKFATLPYVVGEGRRVIGNIERVANLFLTKTVYAVLLALLVGIAGVAGKIFGFASLAYPFQPIHITISAWFTIGVPAFVLSLAPNNERARTGFVKRVLTHAVPNGIIVGLVTFITFVLVNPGGSDGPRLGIEADHVPPAVAQASTATLMALIATAFYVLVVVARPYTWWKIALLVVSALAYVVIFTWHQTQEWFNLDSSNWGNNAVGLGLAVVGMVAIEVVNRLIPRFVPEDRPLAYEFDDDVDDEELASPARG
ncbi:MAG TPA: HAD-IC family P-type ATPase [Gordonia sp. (in: high G+C Gram-positive bacteria)]|uniref:HAD-IC family P-type ATPase n=1 Tax=unclassified Gordonia (in: high G+C Gram-positive bacteria) TaxID=2657482 RepID=UPI000FC06D4B|nr:MULTISPECIES: HAD-IC family P-type ATPase [unclassified Gordonia (in: high G+C Gram-positive bacteria)]RUP38287.1 MAG: HAD family hydrolase [Gordonia sp. (in: high G+C Gram-positive bacteria)]HNP58086.1 HAD-IC family P-type ATPase [Gordonia sp. (in: high G+C Gram-positive bacteria)]HRC52277.1 HAD-IC family P-type ATPase [Gordonia sp. (in: high G+C Gram-positive bacteria)]